MNRSHTIRIALVGCALTLLAPSTWAADDQAAPTRKDARAAKPEPKPAASASGTVRAKAEDARRRASEANKSGKKLVADRLEKVATIWDKVARHQEQAAKLEREAAEIERETLKLNSKARRAHSLVEQTETRRARALARLRELGLRETPEGAQPQKPNSEPAGPAAQTGEKKEADK